MESRRIKIRTGPDILKWGKSTKGTFLVKEAYYLATRQEREEEVLDWKQIWRNKWWPKVTIFAWLVGKGRILTWDKLQKRGFQGPPRCSLCKQENETQEHLLNSCPYAQHQWDEVRNLFRKSNRDPNDIKQTIFHRGKGKFSCSIVRRIWSLAVGFVIWFLWKERNQRIVRDKNNPPGKMWEKIQKAIRETILAENWEEEEWKTNPEERRILAKLNIEYKMIYPRKERHQRP